MKSVIIIFPIIFFFLSIIMIAKGISIIKIFTNNMQNAIDGPLTTYTATLIKKRTRVHETRRPVSREKVWERSYCLIFRTAGHGKLICSVEPHIYETFQKGDSGKLTVRGTSLFHSFIKAP